MKRVSLSGEMNKTPMEAKMLLRDAGIYPSNEVLEDILGEFYSVFVCFLETITGDGYDLVIEWRYYNDGKAWLGKAQHKKKTVFWLSVWDGFFKTSFYFTEKHLEAIATLDISESIKEDFYKTRSVGRLIPLILEINHAEQLSDLLTVVRFKKSLK